MAGLPGRSGTNKGKDKPFVEALRMEIASAGTDLKRLRTIAAKLLSLADQGDMQAINAIADRLDGKPAQAVEITGDVKHSVIRAPAIAASTQEWTEIHSPNHTVN